MSLYESVQINCVSIHNNVTISKFIHLMEHKVETSQSTSTPLSMHVGIVCIKGCHRKT